MDAETECGRLSRRTFLREVAAMSGAALTSGLLVACGTGTPQVNESPVVHLLWSDVTNAYAPLLADFTAATGINVLQSIVPYNQRLDKINTAVLGGGDFDVVQMDTVWTAQFAAAKWVDDLTDRIADAIKRTVPKSALSAATYQGKLYGIPVLTAPSTYSTTSGCSTGLASTTHPRPWTRSSPRPRQPPNQASGAPSGLGSSLRR
jgi:ABC-type glycerol-3-phosphate transport system substrate-binding protein